MMIIVYIYICIYYMFLYIVTFHHHDRVAALQKKKHLPPFSDLASHKTKKSKYDVLSFCFLFLDFICGCVVFNASNDRCCCGFSLVDHRSRLWEVDRLDKMPRRLGIGQRT